MRQFVVNIVAFLAVVVLTACNVTRNLADDSYLLQRVKIEPDKSVSRDNQITSEEVYKYIRQRPNKHFLGSNFYVEVYNLANPEKDNWWNNLKRRIGEEPVLFDINQTEKSAENIKIYLDSRGYFSSDVDYSVDTTYRRKRAKVTYSFKQGKPYIIDKIDYDFKDRFLEPILLPDSTNRLIHRGDIFNIATLDAERERIAALLKDRGYYNFSVGNISYIADTLNQPYRVALTMIVKQKLAGYNARGEAIYDNNAVYRLRNIEIIPGYNTTTEKSRKHSLENLDTTYYNGLEILFNGKKPYIRQRYFAQRCHSTREQYTTTHLCSEHTTTCYRWASRVRACRLTRFQTRSISRRTSLPMWAVMTRCVQTTPARST